MPLAHTDVFSLFQKRIILFFGAEILCNAVVSAGYVQRREVCVDP